MAEMLNNINPVLSGAEEEAALVKLRKTIFKYLAHLHWFILFIGVALIGAYLYLKYTNPVYSASATMLLVSDDKAGGGEKDLIDALVSGKPKVNVQDEIELIRSRYLLNKVVEKNNFNMDVWVHGKIRASEIYDPLPFTVLRPVLSDSIPFITFSLFFNKNGTFKVNKDSKDLNFNQPFRVENATFQILSNGPRPEYSQYDIKLYNTKTASTRIAGALKITPKANLSRVVELKYSGTNLAKVEKVLQKVMEEYLQLGIDEKRKVHQTTRAFLNERLGVLSGELGSVEGQKESFRRESNIIDVNAQSEQFLQNSSEQSRELSQLLVKRQMITYLISYLSNQANAYNLAPTNLGIEDPILLSSAQNYNTLILEREKELTINTNLSPVVKNIEASIEKSRTSLLENLKMLRSNNEAVIGRLSSERSRVQSQISQVPGKERQLGGIMRQEKIKNDLFSYLLQKREETEIALAGAATEAKILNSALVSPTPISPNRKSVWLLALLIGIVVPFLIIWIKDLLNNKVNTKDDIVSHVAAPILGEIGHNTNEESIVVKPGSRKVIGEQFRNIRSNINFLVPAKSNFLMLTTSTNPGEGKSFTSINLAATYAIAGKRTVLIEMDMRKPKLAQYLKIKSAMGLTGYLIGKNHLNEIVKQIPGYDNLFLLDAGVIPPNPAELMMSARMSELVEELKKNYEVIIFDCPPVGLVSDAQIIAPIVDLSVYIIRQRVTLKSQLSFIKELYESSRLKKMGVIVNDVKATGYYGYYGYGNNSYGGYGYGVPVNGNENGDGYFEVESRKKSWFSIKGKA